MATEKTLWQYIRKGMGNRWNVQRHEDKHSIGVPDLSYGMNYINGWVELKTIPAWPKRPGTIVKVDHFTQEQRLWLFLRGESGGHCYLLLKVNETKEYFLFDYTTAQNVGKTMIRQNFYENCRGYWKGVIQWEELAEALN